MKPMLTKANSLIGSEAGGDEEIHRVGLDVTAEIGKALLFRGFVFLVCAACANVEGLHRDAIMHQDGTLFNNKQTIHHRGHEGTRRRSGDLKKPKAMSQERRVKREAPAARG